MREHIEAYLKDHETAWAPSTLKSESARLRRLSPHLDLTPEALHEHLIKAGKKPYTIKTTFIRLVDLERWAGLDKRFARYMEKHGRRFKHLYVKEEVKITYAEAYKRIMGLGSPCREHALGMLQCGVRISESYNVQAGEVIGKGGKPRKVYGTIKETAAKSTLTRKLKAVGLKPHMLRKLCATRLAEKGASPADLCKVFGWTSIETAYQYLQPKDDARLAAYMETPEEESDRADI